MTAVQNTEKTEVTTQKESKTLKDWLGSDYFKQALQHALPTHMKPDRFVRIALTQIMKTPKLAECSQESVLKAMLDLSSLGLEPDGRRAHLIPFRNNKTGKTEVQLIIDYKGLIELAKRSGEIVMWRAELVCEKDGFGWSNGIVDHKINWLAPRGKVLAVYSHVKNKSGVDEYEVLTLEDVEHARKKSRAANDGPWKTDFNEMAKKTAIRRHSKKLTLSPEFHEALVKDDDADFGIEGEFEPMSDDLMPKALIEKVEDATPVTPIAPIETTPVKDFDPKSSDEPPAFTDTKTQAKQSHRITKNQIQDIQTALVKYHRQAGAFYSFLQETFGINDIGSIEQSDLDSVLDWIQKD